MGGIIGIADLASIGKFEVCLLVLMTAAMMAGVMIWIASFSSVSRIRSSSRMEQYCMNWSNLPDHIVVDILSYLSLEDRYHTSLVCQNWYRCFDSPLVWSHFTFKFYEPSHKRFLNCCQKYGSFLKLMRIELDQSEKEYRQIACQVIQAVAQLEERRLQKIELKFIGENPYFYAGQEFVQALSHLFGPVKEDVTIVTPLQEVYLGGLTVSYSDTLFDILSENHKELKVLDIQNRVLVCKVSPTCILKVVHRCRKLRDLRVYHCSLDEEILHAFMEENRAPLRHLSFLCRREEKYMKDIDAEVWRKLTQALPDLRVTLGFDHTCPLHKVSEIMIPEIPVAVLRLETFTYISDEVILASTIYINTLQKLVLEAPLSKTSPVLNQALIQLVTECKHLSALHVYCVLSKDTVEKILELNPKLVENKSYTLKYTEEPAPWKSDEEFIPGLPN